MLIFFFLLKSINNLIFTQKTESGGLKPLKLLINWLKNKIKIKEARTLEQVIFVFDLEVLLNNNNLIIIYF